MISNQHASHYFHDYFTPGPTDFHYQCDQCDYFDHVCMNVTVVFENHDDEYDDAGDADGDEFVGVAGEVFKAQDPDP